MNILLWLIFIALSSATEALTYHLHTTNSNRTRFDEHFMYNAVRIFVAAVIFRDDLCQWQTILLAGAIVASFPFLHDGLYYAFRHVLDRKMYPATFFDQSSDTDAKWSFPPLTRIALLLLSVLLYALYLRYS